MYCSRRVKNKKIRRVILALGSDGGNKHSTLISDFFYFNKVTEEFVDKWYECLPSRYSRFFLEGMFCNGLSREFFDKYFEAAGPNIEYCFKFDVTEEFIHTYKDKLDISRLFPVNYIEEPVLKSIYHILSNEDIIDMMIYQKLSHEFIDELIDHLVNNGLDIDILINERLSSCAHSPASFLEKYKDKLNWVEVSSYNKNILKHKNLRKFKDYVNWSNIWGRVHLNENIISGEFSEKINKYSWRSISANSTLSTKLMYEYKDKICWDYVNFWKNIPEDLMEEFYNPDIFIRRLSTQKFSEEFLINHIEDIKNCGVGDRYLEVNKRIDKDLKKRILTLLAII
jgi:hypothetical protein